MQRSNEESNTLVKTEKICPSCDEQYIVVYLETSVAPVFCPFCGESDGGED